MPFFASVIPFRRAVTTRRNEVRPAARLTIKPAKSSRKPITTASRSSAVPKREEMFCLYDALEMAVDRIEDALAKDDLNLTGWQFASLLTNSFPELYRQPPTAERTTDSAIGTPDRVEQYVRRANAGKAVFNPADAQADLLGNKNLLLGGFVNQSTFRVQGWSGKPSAVAVIDEESCAECGMDLPAMMKPGHCRCGI